MFTVGICFGKHITNLGFSFRSFCLLLLFYKVYSFLHICGRNTAHTTHTQVHTHSQNQVQQIPETYRIKTSKRNGWWEALEKSTGRVISTNEAYRISSFSFFKNVPCLKKESLMVWRKELRVLYTWARLCSGLARVCSCWVWFNNKESPSLINILLNIEPRLLVQVLW